jgi:predicted ABC-type ATPase
MEHESFAFETTLATKSYKNKVLKAKQMGYTVTLLFFWLNSVELAKERVKTRVKEGGHDIPSDVIQRRYFKGIKNLFEIYMEIVNGALIFDNSYGKHELIAQKIEHEDILILDSEKFQQLKKYYEQQR